MTAAESRVVVVVALLVGWSLWVTIPASSQEADLERYFRDFEAADFSGRMVVVSWTSDGLVAAGTYDVEQSDGLLEVGNGQREVALSEGRLMSRATDGGWRLISFAGSRQSGLEPRYRVTAGNATLLLGRPIHSVEVWERSRLRMHFAFDRETSVPLLTEVFDDQGALYRLSEFLEFSPRPSRTFVPHLPSEAVVEAARPTTLPDRAGGYQLRGSYRGPGDSVHAFYSDGLFVVSVFEIAGRIDVAELGQAAEVLVGGHSYRRRHTPTETWLVWLSPDYTYLLVGDLPPDHLEAALTELPAPSTPSLLSRLWRALRDR